MGEKEFRRAGCLLCLAFFLGVAASSAFAENVSITRKITEENKSGTKLINKTLDIKIPYGQISYRGMAPERGREVEGLQFGLNFLRPPKTNGGWDGWNFLRVGVRVGQERISVFKRYPLDNAYVLESERRVMTRFVWSLPDKETQVMVTTLQYPTHPDWLFLRIEARGKSDDLDTIDLSCFPGNTSGPPERERWLATLNTTVRLDAKGIDLDSADNAFVFYNLMAQINDGCQLVVDPKPVESIAIRGISSVQTGLRLKPNQSTIMLALGGYVDKHTEDVVRVFRFEGAAQIQAFLEKIDWTPQFDLADHERLVRTLEELVVAAPSAAVRFQALKNQYATASRNKDFEAVLANVRELEQLKDKLVSEALEKWK